MASPSSRVLASWPLIAAAALSLSCTRPPRPETAEPAPTTAPAPPDAAALSSAEAEAPGGASRVAAKSALASQAASSEGDVASTDFDHDIVFSTSSCYFAYDEQGRFTNVTLLVLRGQDVEAAGYSWDPPVEGEADAKEEAEGNAGAAALAQPAPDGP